MEAARHLNLTPAAVAQRIEALEKDVGVALVARSGRVVRPTAAGGAIVEKARSFLREVRDLRSIAAGTTVIGNFRLGAISTALTGYMPELLAAFMQKHPAVDVFIEPGTSDNLYKKVIDEELDAAIIVEPTFELPKTLNFAPIGREPLIVLCSASIASRDSDELLSTQPFIRYDRRHWGGRLADDYLRKLKIEPQEHLELDSLEAIAVLVDRELGISLIPDWAPPWPSDLNIAKVPLKRGSPARTIGAIWSAHSLRISIINSFFRRE